MKKKIKQKGLAVKKSNKRAVIKSLECWGCQNKKGREMTEMNKKALLKNNFYYLMKEMKLRDILRRKINLILENLIAKDPLQITKFEYSLQIEKKLLKNNFRFTNFCKNYYLNVFPDLYTKRINLIKNIALSYVDQKTNLINFFTIIKKFSRYQLPLHFGLESQENEDIFLKFYLGFNDLYKKNRKLTQKIIQDILNKLNSKIKTKKRKIIFLGLTMDKSGKFIKYNLYYVYNKKVNFKNFDFTQQEFKFFRWLNCNNKLDYFYITERYINNKFISRKIEIQPIITKDFLKRLLKISCSKMLMSRIERIITKINGEINVVSFEKNKLTIYIKMLNYGTKPLIG